MKPTTKDAVFSEGRENGDIRLHDAVFLAIVSARMSDTEQQDFTITTEVYSGPLAALLELVRKRKKSVHDIDLKEIAEDLSISVKTVETQMGRALRFLRGRFSAQQLHALSPH